MRLRKPSVFARLLTFGIAAMTLCTLTLTAFSNDVPEPPPTLSGEEFSLGTLVTKRQCNPVEGISTVSFVASGQATGPYAGTYTEEGTATIGVHRSVGGGYFGTLLTFDTVFTIQSSSGTVRGTKTLAFPVTDNGTQVAVGTCFTEGDYESADALDRYTVQYDAQIETGSGTYADSGLTPEVYVQDRIVVSTGAVWYQAFRDTFASGATATTPLISAGQATGGGKIAGGLTFGFHAKSDGNEVKGTCIVIDRATNTTLKCSDASTYYQSGVHAVIVGNGTLNGIPTTYRIVVDDNGEPGIGTDTFSITTASGYAASGTVALGDIRVYR